MSDKPADRCRARLPFLSSSRTRSTGSPLSGVGADGLKGMARGSLLFQGGRDAESDGGAVLNALELGDGLLTAARKGNLEIVRKYLGKGAQVNGGDQYGWTALHCAAFKGHAEVVGELLAHGANVQSRDLEGHTPLHCAVETGHKEVVQLLIGKGADVNAKSVRGATPLNIAATLKYAGILRFLLNRGADRALIQVVPDGCIPLDSASFRRNRHTSLVFVQ